MPLDQVIDLPVIGRAGTLQSVDAESRSFEVLWTTGAQVRRYSWARDEEFDEELVVAGEALRLDRLNAGAPFLNSHSSYSLRSILGVVVEGSIRVEGGKAFARIRLSERADVEDIWRDIQAGIIRNVSVGYRVHKFERIAQADRKDGGNRALYRAIDWEPLEISAVAIGADAGAGIRSEAGAADDRRNACVIRSITTVAAPAAPTQEQVMANENLPAGGEDARNDQTTHPQTTTPAAPDANAIRAEERQRVTAITALCQRHGLADLAQTHIDKGSSLDVVRAAALDAIADNDPAGPISGGVPAQARGDGAREVAYRDAVVASLLHRYNPSAHALPDAAREFRGLRLLELVGEVVSRRGTSVRGLSPLERAGAAFEMRSAGYHSVSDFPSILADVANKSLRGAYQSTPRTFVAWARRATISDFKPVNRAQLGGAPDLVKVPGSGEFKYGTMGDGKETYRLATYGRVMGLTRQTIINDDLDAFTRIPEAFGASAADLESDIVYGVLIANANMADGKALFHADHGNLATGATINETSLALAYRTFGAQKGLEGRLISILPRSIIVPPGARAIEARKHVTQTTPTSASDVNAFAGRLEVVEEPRLIPASGQDPWFLAADPARIDTVEYAYLEGQEGVFVETQLGFDVDGMKIKARHDFAAAAIDHRGLHKNPGASS